MISGNGMRRPIKSKSLPGSIIQAKANKINKEKQAAPVIHKRRSLPAAMPSTSSHKTSEISPICISTIEELDTVECRLSLAAVECSLLPRRVLVAKGGLLYAGELAEIQAPDLYSVTLDGERAHRPHIYTQEEVLNDILQEVKLAVAPAQGTRVCAFWSQQYRCLYPGRVSSNQYQYPDHKFVCVEFDDGDDGRIPLDDIRLLPHDYPVVEYDPNPLLTLGKRKRRISTASSEHSTKTNITADLALDGSLEEIDEDIQERDEAIAEEDGHKTTEGEEEDDVEENGEDGDEQDNDDDNNEQEAGVVNEEEKIDEESDEGEENPEKDEESNGEADNNEKTIQEEEILNNKDVNSANGSAEVEPEASRKTVNVSTEEEKERRRLKKKKRDKHRLGMEEEGDGVAHKKKKKHRECCNKPHRHHKHKHHKHRHHKHRHSSVDGSETNKEEVDENGVAEAKVSDGRSVVRAPSRPLQADTSNMKEYKRQQHRDRQNSVEGGKSKMAAFLPAKQLWQWLGKGYKRPGAKGRSRKEFYKSIHRENETISVGDCAVFLSTGRPDRPFIGRIESMWSSWSHNMLVKVKWFYHPEETVGCPEKLTYPGALFESPHNDENDVQTISHKCEVLSLSDYKNWLSRDPERVETIYDYNDIYYLAGYYDPTNVNLTFEPGVI